MVTIGSDEIATFSTGNKKLDFTNTGITPYYASAVESGKVTLTAVSDKTTWGYQGYILKGSEGTYEVPATDNATYQNTDYLKATGDYSAEVAASTNETYHYIFAKKTSGDNTPAFYKLTSAYTLGAHKAYLETSTDVTPADARVSLLFSDDETTAVQTIEAIERPQSDKIYNISGQQVGKPTRGFYIINGKKVIIK